MTRRNLTDQYPDGEAQHRFEMPLRAALNTPPKQLKSMARRGVPPQRKKPAKASS